MSWQLLSVVTLVAGSAVFVARRVWRFWRGAQTGDPVGPCGTCGTCDAAKPPATPTGGGFVALETFRHQAADEAARHSVDHPAIQR